MTDPLTMSVIFSIIFFLISITYAILFFMLPFHVRNIRDDLRIVIQKLDKLDPILHSLNRIAASSPNPPDKQNRTVSNTSAYIGPAMLISVTHVRSTPDDSGSVLGLFNAGDRVTILKQEDGWSQVVTAESDKVVIGWIRNEHLYK